MESSTTTAQTKQQVHNVNDSINAQHKCVN